MTSRRSGILSALAASTLLEDIERVMADATRSNQQRIIDNQNRILRSLQALLQNQRKILANQTRILKKVK